MKLPFGYRIVKQERVDQRTIQITVAVDTKTLAEQVRKELARRPFRDAMRTRGPRAGGNIQINDGLGL